MDEVPSKHVWNMSNLIRAIYDSNLCTYYLLPLVRLNRFSFGKDNFVQCYVSRDGSKLFVELKDIPEFIYKRKDYLGTSLTPTGVCAVIALPEDWYNDFVLFKAGKYSKFSPEFQVCVAAYCGLPVNKLNKDGILFTDARIVAMDNVPMERAKLRRILSRELEVEIPEDQELISVPNDSEYMDDAPIIKTLRPRVEV